MIVKAYYPGGLVDVFDTDHFTEALPLRGNLLTNYVLDWSGALSGGGIWMRAYWHETADEYRGVVDDAGLPVARRRDGWSFLMADAGDVAMLERLTSTGRLCLSGLPAPSSTPRRSCAPTTPPTTSAPGLSQRTDTSRSCRATAAPGTRRMRFAGAWA